jgi:hypothetical protein
MILITSLCLEKLQIVSAHPMMTGVFGQHVMIKDNFVGALILVAVGFGW